MTMAKINNSVKAFKNFMAKQKNVSDHLKTEYEIAFQTNNNRGHVYNQSELKELYNRDSWNGNTGATKVTHMTCHDGIDFEFIVVKRFKEYGWIRRDIGNQLVREIQFWQKYANTEYADLLCPMLKFFTSKSDKVNEFSEKMKDNVIIISQKAIFVSSAQTCCNKAEELNEQYGYDGDSSWYRYELLKDFSNKNEWEDCMNNPGNSGVIFDYNSNCFKAVFIDYAL